MALTNKQIIYLKRTGLHVQNLVKHEVDAVSFDESRLIMEYTGKSVGTTHIILGKYSASSWDYVENWLKKAGFKF